MIRRLLFPCLLLCACLCRANVIDSLHSKTDVINFLTKYVNEHCKDWNIFVGKYDVLGAYEADQHRTNNYYKADVDGNGLTDLIVDGWYATVMLDKENTYEEHRVDNTLFFSRYIFKDTLRLPGEPLMLIYEDRASYRPHEKISIDTFVYKFGELVEYNEHPHDQHIKKIKLSATGCYGTCPMYDLEVNADGSMWLNAEMYNKPDGNFFGRLNKEQMEEWRALNEYVNYNAIKGAFYNVYESKGQGSIAVSDGAGAKLTIEYEDGSVKKIISEDKMNICLGARAVYNFLKKIRETDIWTDWKTVSEENDRNAIAYSVSFHNYFDYADRTYYTLSSAGAKGIKVYESGYRVFKLWQNHRFVYTYHSASKYLPNKFAIGNWQQANDSTIIFNWDGVQTLKKIRDSSYTHYFPAANAIPIRVDHWRFSVSKDRKVIDGMNRD